MIATPDLIESLAANMKPVRRLRPPVTRAAFWLLLAALVVALLAVSQGIRPDLAQRLHDPTLSPRSYCPYCLSWDSRRASAHSRSWS